MWEYREEYRDHISARIILLTLAGVRMVTFLSGVRVEWLG